MKGIVLAGGLGTRFHPVTTVVNKHLLDVYDEPMIFHPIRTLARAGITEIVVVTGDEIPQFKRLLGDNIFQEDLRPYLDAYEHQEKGAKVLLKEVSLEDARRFGVAHIEDGRLARVDEKPPQPTSTLVVTGCYLYDARVFDLIRLLMPSERGELEVSDLNNLYIDDGTMTFDVLRGWWTDAGTPASKLKASILVALAKGVTFQS